MSQAFKRQSPALAHLLSTIPDYQQWFLHWKALRDKVKGGVNFGFVTGDDPSVTFLATRDLPDSGGLAVGGQGDQVVRMSELTHALVQMTSLVRAIRSGPTVPR